MIFRMVVFSLCVLALLLGAPMLDDDKNIEAMADHGCHAGACRQAEGVPVLRRLRRGGRSGARLRLRGIFRASFNNLNSTSHGETPDYHLLV